MKNITIAFKSIRYFIAEVEVPDSFDALDTGAIHLLLSNRKLDGRENELSSQGGFFVDEVTDHSVEETYDLHFEACQRCQKVLAEAQFEA